MELCKNKRFFTQKTRQFTQGKHRNFFFCCSKLVTPNLHLDLESTHLAILKTRELETCQFSVHWTRSIQKQQNESITINLI